MKLKLGMVGGGPGAFIGAVHRNAAWLDGEFELVSGAFSSDPAKSAAQGHALGLDPARVYGTFDEMMQCEAALPEAERTDCVSIVTPNHTHFEIAQSALAAGFHVICDKPLTHDLADAIELAKLVDASGRIFALTHNYTGYPLVKEARQRVATGELGPLRKVIVEYTQGWLSEPLEAVTDIWRTDPLRSGMAGCMGDIGSHAFNLLEYVTGQHVTEVSAELTAFVPGRQLDDDGNVLVRMSEGARGVLHASQVCVGEENDLRLRIYGEKAGLVWRQQMPNELVIKSGDGVDRVIRAGVNHTNSHQALAATRLPGGHPEGFIEAFANIYRGFAAAVRAHPAPPDTTFDYPDVHAGVRTMAFIDAIVANSAGTKKWTTVNTDRSTT